MAWRNMRGGWEQNASQGFRTRREARAAVGLRPIDPKRPHLRWYAGRVQKVTTPNGHYWEVSHFIKTVTVESTLSGGLTFVFTSSGLYGPYGVAILMPDGTEFHHSYTYNDPSYLTDILTVGAN